MKLPESILEAMFESAKDSQGVEGSEEFELDGMFLIREFEDSMVIFIEYGKFAANFEGVDVFDHIIPSAMLAGIMLYRDWLSDRGFDVLKLEGRDE